MTLTAPFIETCLDLFVDFAGHYTALQVQFVRTVLLPFLQLSPDNLPWNDPRMRVWDRLMYTPYFVSVVFSTASDAELTLLFKNDGMGGSRVWSMVRPMLTRPLENENYDVQRRRLPFAARLLRLDPVPGNLSVCVRFIRAAEDPFVCESLFESLLREILDTADAPDAFAFWKQLLFNAILLFDGGNAGGTPLAVRWYIFGAIVRTFSGSVQSLGVFQASILEDGAISAQLERAGLIGDMYAALFTAYAKHGSASGAWRKVFPSAAEACKTVVKGNVAAALARWVSSSMTSEGEETRLLTSITTDMHAAPEMFGIRSAFLQKMLRPCYPYTSRLLRACSDMLTHKELARGRLGMELVAVAVQHTSTALQRVWQCSSRAPLSGLEGGVFCVSRKQHEEMRCGIMRLPLPITAVPFRDRLRNLLSEAVQTAFSGAGEATDEVWITMCPTWLASAVAYNDVLHALGERNMSRRWINENLISPTACPVAASETLECLSTHSNSLRMTWLTACVQQSLVENENDEVSGAKRRNC